MRRNTRERWIFCAVSFALLLCAATYRPAIDGNSPGEISRFLRWEMADRGIGPIQLLAVEDEGADRFAVFQGEKRPDERYLVRFRQNEDGEYEADGHPMWMYGPYPVRGVYSQALDPELVESCVYQISAVKARCNYLIRAIKERSPDTAAAAGLEGPAAWT